MTGSSTIAVRAVRVLACGAFVLGALCACGGEARASDPTAVRLQADVLALTRAAATGNDAGARTALLALTRDVSAARAAGTISALRARQLDEDITAVTADLRDAAPATPTTTPATSPSTPRPTVQNTTVVVPEPATAPTAAKSKATPKQTPKTPPAKRPKSPPAKTAKKPQPPHKHGPAG